MFMGPDDAGALLASRIEDPVVAAEGTRVRHPPAGAASVPPTYNATIGFVLAILDAAWRNSRPRPDCSMYKPDDPRLGSFLEVLEAIDQSRSASFRC